MPNPHPKPTAIVALRADALPGTNKREYCKACTHEFGYLARYVKVNGVECIRWVCDWCENYTTAGDLPQTILPEGVTVDLLPLRQDNTSDNANLCVVCDAIEVEYHHWAPTSIFPDWGHVPGIFLCPSHHTEWHDRLRLHGLRWPGELDAA